MWYKCPYNKNGDFAHKRIQLWHKYTTLFCKGSLLGSVSINFYYTKRNKNFFRWNCGYPDPQIPKGNWNYICYKIMNRGQKIERMPKILSKYISDTYLQRFRKATKHPRQRSGFWTPIPKWGVLNKQQICQRLADYGLSNMT